MTMRIALLLFILLLTTSSVYAATFDINEEAIAYGQMFGRSDANISIGVTSANVFFPIHGLNGSRFRNTEFDNNYTLFLNSSGRWLVVFSFSFEAGGSGEYEFALFVNNTNNEREGCHTDRTVAGVSDIGSVSFNCIIDVPTGSNISVHVRDSKTPPKDVKWHSFDLSTVLLETTDRRSDKTNAIALAIVAGILAWMAFAFNDERQGFKILLFFGSLLMSASAVFLVFQSTSDGSLPFQLMLWLLYAIFGLFFIHLVRDLVLFMHKLLTTGVKTDEQDDILKF